MPKSRAKSTIRQIAKDDADGIIRLDGEVSELADEHDLGSCAARRAGSSPAFPMWAGAERFGDGGEQRALLG